ncbi:SpoIVB peptidase [Natribacillus halophilus]|uniref:Stage IV sporulation protein B n=1 Tax=Natribacillus halophilus TaxID=549003 RepID=A0A1G8JJT9_9BACI|nr:SpoIVB peptidase [Natribacillus halophilus]SDI31297.1 stage IV sporulation protein B [Natribacillus halophilus]
MKSDRTRKIVGTLLLIGVLSLSFLKPVEDWLQLPDQITTMQGEATSAVDRLENELPSFFSIEDEKEDVVQVTAGSTPIKNISQDKVPRVEVTPGGQSVGVRLSSQGVMVVGFHTIHTAQGQQSPAEAAGIQKGDIIVKIDQQPVEDMTEVASILRSPEDSKAMQIELIRNGEKMEKTVQPSVTAAEDSKQQLGLYIRDSAAGVGTMTFFDPNTRKYGALGHVISDVDTKRPLSIHEGEIVRSSVNAIERGENGIPGEKQASIVEKQDVLGTITKNNTFGIYGQLNQDHKLHEDQEPMPIAYAEEVEEGPAKILTVVENEEVEAFDVEIVRSTPQKHAATKGMVIKVTDDRLVEKTGGIVQGMSGSPIIQNDKIIGAVTHVFVNDATAGYGSHIEWMLEEADIDQLREARKAS